MSEDDVENAKRAHKIRMLNYQKKLTDNIQEKFFELREMIVLELLNELKTSSFLADYSWEEFEAGLRPSLEKSAGEVILKQLLSSPSKS